MKLQRRRQLIPYEQMRLMFNDLKKELKAKPASCNEPLDKLVIDFIDLLAYARQKLDVTVAQLTTELRLRFPQNPMRLGPTQLANIAEVHREYGLQRYGIDTELFWLRILKIVRADSNFYPILEDTKTQLDFSVVTTALLGTLTIVWFIPSMLLAPTPIPYLLSQD